MNSKDEILNEIDGRNGYIVFNIGLNDLEIINKIVNLQYTFFLTQFYPHMVEKIKKTSINHYHTLGIEGHKDIWTKERRTLFESEIDTFKNISFIKNLKKYFIDLAITNEDSTRSEEIYWRLVRPNQKDDIGPLHADSWFWDLQNGPIKKGFRRIKIWISLHNEQGVSGFKLIPGSHLKNYEFKGEFRDGKMKPIVDDFLENDRNAIIVPTKSGDAILFHDNLIHGGSFGKEQTRVSIEFTMLVRA